MLQQCLHMHRFGFLHLYCTEIFGQTGPTFHGSETVKRALREKDEGILIDGQKKRKLTKKDKDSLKK